MHDDRVPAKPAQPARFVVDRIGTPDPPNTEYYVLDLVNNWLDREALAYLGNKYRQHGRDQLAAQCFGALDATNAEFGRVMDARNPQKKKAKKQ